MDKYLGQKSVAALKEKIQDYVNSRPAMYTIGYGSPGILTTDWTVVDRSLSSTSIPADPVQKTYLAIIIAGYHSTSTTLATVNFAFSKDDNFVTNVNASVGPAASGSAVSGQSLLFYRLYQSDLSTINFAVRTYGGSSGSATRLNTLRVLFLELI